MKKNATRITRYAFLALAAANLIGFGLTLLSFLYSELDAVYYITDFAMVLLEDLITVSTAATALLSLEYISKKNWLISSLILALTKMFYLLPYDFLQFEFGGYDTGEAIQLSLIQSILECAFNFGVILLLSFVAHAIIIRQGKRDTAPAPITAAAFDFSSKYTVAVFAIAVLIFAKNFITEVIYTVSYLVDFAGTYLAEEIILMVFSYVFILISLLLAHALGCFIARAGSKFILKDG